MELYVYSSTCGTQFFQHWKILLKTLSFLQCMLIGTFIEKQMVVDAQVYFGVLYSILVYVSMEDTCQHHIFLLLLL